MQASIASSRLDTYLPCGKDRTNPSRDRFVAETRKGIEAAAAANISDEGREEKGAKLSRIPTSILLIKVITLRTKSANLILIDVKLGAVWRRRGWAYKKRMRMRLEWKTRARAREGEEGVERVRRRGRIRLK